MVPYPDKLSTHKAARSLVIYNKLHQTNISVLVNKNADLQFCYHFIISAQGHPKRLSYSMGVQPSLKQQYYSKICVGLMTPPKAVLISSF
jgi:hypothetical protein